MAFSISGFFHRVEAAIHDFFTRNGGAIQAVVSAASTAVGVASAVAADFGEPPVVAAELAKIQDGLALVAAGVNAQSTATDLTGHAAALAALVTGLVTSGDIGIKNATTQVAIGVAANKVKSVIGTLESAAVNAPKPKA